MLRQKKEKKKESYRYCQQWPGPSLLAQESQFVFLSFSQRVAHLFKKPKAQWVSGLGTLQEINTKREKDTYTMWNSYTHSTIYIKLKQIREMQFTKVSQMTLEYNIKQYFNMKLFVHGPTKKGREMSSLHNTSKPSELMQCFSPTG